MTKTNQDKKQALSLIRSEEGSGFIEKLIIIGLFIFVVAAGIKYVGGAANDKLNAQGKSINKVNTDVGGKAK